MTILQKITNFIKPSPAAKPVRERDKIKPFNGGYNDTGIFTYTDDGFAIELKDGIQKIRWDQVEKLTAYKIDLMAYDEICLNAVCANGRFTITEDTPGWYQFVERTKKNLRGIDKEWDVKIVYPSFATNLTILYEKPGMKV